MDRNVIVAPKTVGLRQSACTPLWYVVYRHRPTAKSVIHTHSMYAQLATLLDPTESSRVLRITHLEMLKGVGHHAYDDILEIPIIDNRPSEDMLADQLESALQEYPKCNCVLVRRHGLYVWGDSWEQAKTQAESFDYLFHSAIEMKKVRGGGQESRGSIVSGFPLSFSAHIVYFASPTMPGIPR
jgi:methylthioribulose-1-phosphate dehydratase